MAMPLPICLKQLIYKVTKKYDKKEGHIVVYFTLFGLSIIIIL